MCPQRPWILPQNIPLEQQALKKKQKNNRLQYFANFSFSCSQQRNWLHLITSYDEKFHKECGSKFTTNWQLHKPSNWTLFSLLPFLTWREFLLFLCFEFEYSSSRKTKSNCIKEHQTEATESRQQKTNRNEHCARVVPLLGWVFCGSKWISIALHWVVIQAKLKLSPGLPSDGMIPWGQ